MPRPAYSAEERERIEGDIRDAALRLFRRDGYRAVSLRALAKELAWSAPALYRYYSSKDALLAAIRADGFDEIRDLLAAQRKQVDAPLEAVARSMKAYVAFALEKPALYQLMYELDQGEVATEAEVAKNRRRAFAEAEGMARDVLQALERAGDINEMAHLFWVSAHGLAALAVANQLDLGKQIDQLIEPVVDVVVRGVALQERGE